MKIGYSVAYYVDMYISNLQKLGFNVINGRILQDYDVVHGKWVSRNYYEEYEDYMISGEKYWFCSTSTMSRVLYVSISVGENGYASNDESGCGVRVVVTINTDDLE